jgi:hypothetical protein
MQCVRERIPLKTFFQPYIFTSEECSEFDLALFKVGSCVRFGDAGNDEKRLARAIGWLLGVIGPRANAAGLAPAHRTEKVGPASSAASRFLVAFGFELKVV